MAADLKHRMYLVEVTKEDLEGGVKGDCCPILAAIQRALGVKTPEEAKFSQKQWAQFHPFVFYMELKPDDPDRKGVSFQKSSQTQKAQIKR